MFAGWQTGTPAVVHRRKGTTAVLSQGYYRGSTLSRPAIRDSMKNTRISREPRILGRFAGRDHGAYDGAFSQKLAGWCADTYTCHQERVHTTQKEKAGPAGTPSWAPHRTQSSQQLARLSSPTIVRMVAAKNFLANHAQACEAFFLAALVAFRCSDQSLAASSS